MGRIHSGLFFVRRLEQSDTPLSRRTERNLANRVVCDKYFIPEDKILREDLSSHLDLSGCPLESLHR